MTEKNSAQFYQIIIAFLVFLFPLFFLPLTQDFYHFNKTLLLYFSVGLLLFFWAVQVFVAKKFTWKKNELSFPLIGLSSAFLISTFFKSPNKIDTLNNLTGTILALSFLTLIIINYCQTKKAKTMILGSFILSLLVLSWQTILSFFGLLNFGPEWLRQKIWTLSGSPLTTGQLLLLSLPAVIFWACKTKSLIKKISLFIIAIFQAFSLGLLATLLVKKVVVVQLLPLNFGWPITVEGMKNLGTALFGSGPGNFLVNFNHFKPLAINQTSLWTQKFTSSSNQYLTLWSTVGLVGLLSYLWFNWASLRKWPTTLIHQAAWLILGLNLTSQLFLPASLSILFGTFIMAGLVVKTQGEVEVNNNKLVFGLSLLALFFSFFTFYRSIRIWRADYNFFKSLNLASSNQAVQTYESQIKTVMLNPFAENYHFALSQTNFALANNLAQKKDLTDKEKSSLNQLLLQAISEAKTTVNLNPQRADYWLNLALLYRNLVTVADDAKDWSQAAYLQAIKNDPVNPLLRVELGGLFFSTKNYDQAIQLFNQSVELKPDFGNGYYNLAAAYREKEDWQKALTSMETVLTLVPENSSDYIKASQELEEIKKQIPVDPKSVTTATSEQNLTQPERQASPKPGFSNLTLPKETGIEKTEVATPSLQPI